MAVRCRSGWIIAALTALLPASIANAEAPELHGNFQYDFARISSDAMLLDSDLRDWRRRRVAVAWKPAAGFEFKLEFDDASRRWTDLMLEWTADQQRWRVGQFKQPFNMETLTSDKHSMFMESSVGSLFGIERRVGIEYSLIQPSWVASVAAFGQDLAGRNDGAAAAARLTWTPPVRDGARLHLGAALAREHPDADTNSLSTRPESALGGLRLARTGLIDQIDRSDRIGAELAWQSGPLLLQSELAQLRLRRDHGDDVTANGGYVSVGWMLTGESRSYKQGVFTSATPTRRAGSVEAALRYARIEFHGAGVNQGQESWTAGLNWVLRGDTRIMLNHVRGHQTHPAAFPLSPSITEARLQLVF